MSLEAASGEAHLDNIRHGEAALVVHFGERRDPDQIESKAVGSKCGLLCTKLRTLGNRHGVAF